MAFFRLLLAAGPGRFGLKKSEYPYNIFVYSGMCRLFIYGL